MEVKIVRWIGYGTPSGGGNKATDRTNKGRKR